MRRVTGQTEQEKGQSGENRQEKRGNAGHVMMKRRRDSTERIAPGEIFFSKTLIDLGAVARFSG